MRALLAGFGFAVVEDDDLATIATRISAELAGAGRLVKALAGIRDWRKAGEPARDFRRLVYVSPATATGARDIVHLLELERGK